MNSKPTAFTMAQTTRVWWIPLVLTGLTAPLTAQEPAPSNESVAARIRSGETGWERDHLTGNWGGVRDKMVGKGVHLSAAYALEGFANVDGGIERGAVLAGLFEVGLDLDPSRFSAWKHAMVHVSMLYPHGSSLSDKVGDLSTVSNIDADDAWKLFEWWLDQRLFRDRVSIRLGQLAADEEFSGSDYASLLLNATFGWPSFDGINAPAPAFPLAALGARLGVRLHESLLWHAGIYDGDPDPGDSQGRPVNKHGTRIHLSREEGAFIISEAIYTLPLKDEATGRPGTYKLGGWYHTGDFPNLGVANAEALGWVNDNWGIYMVADQRVWREPNRADGTLDPDQGLSLWMRASTHPGESSLVEHYIDAGFHYRGLLPGRDQDEAGIGVAWLSLSDNARHLADLLGEPQPDYEIAIEASYFLHLNTWWSLQPDIQYIIQPGGLGDIPNALVLGLRTSVIF